MFTARRLFILAFVLGLLLSAAMLWRAQAGGDQLNLLTRGWLWAERGELVTYGNPLSSGGSGPGAVTSLLVGAPLFVWRDHRAPIVLIWLFHLAAFLLLDRTLAPALSPPPAAISSPWVWGRNSTLRCFSWEFFRSSCGRGGTCGCTGGESLLESPQPWRLSCSGSSLPSDRRS